MGCGQCLKWRETGRKRRPAVKVHVRVHLHLAARQFGNFRESFVFLQLGFLCILCAAASISLLPLRQLLARQPSPCLSHRIAHLPQRRARETIFARKLFHRAHRRVASLNGQSRSVTPPNVQLDGALLRGRRAARIHPRMDARQHCQRAEAGAKHVCGAVEDWRRCAREQQQVTSRERAAAAGARNRAVAPAPSRPQAFRTTKAWRRSPPCTLSSACSSSCSLSSSMSLRFAAGRPSPSGGAACAARRSPACARRRTGTSQRAR